MTRRAFFAVAALFAVAPAAAHDAGVHPAPSVSGPPTAGPSRWRRPEPTPRRRSGRRPTPRAASETGAPVSLADIYDGRISVLAFMYTRCGDLCPTATIRMADLRILAEAGRA